MRAGGCLVGYFHWSKILAFLGRADTLIDGGRKLQFFNNTFDLRSTRNLKLRLIDEIASYFSTFIRGTHSRDYHRNVKKRSKVQKNTQERKVNSLKIHRGVAWMNEERD